MPKSGLRRGNSFPDDRPRVERRRSYLLLWKHHATCRQDAETAGPIKQGRQAGRERNTGVRPSIDTPTTTASFAEATGTVSPVGKFTGAESPMRVAWSYESDGSAPRMMDALKQTGMLAGYRDAPRDGSKTTIELAAGVILCSSAVTLLYALGKRDEK